MPFIAQDDKYAIEAMMRLPDKVEHIAKVRLHGNTDTLMYYLVVVHHALKQGSEACLLLLHIPSEGGTIPIVHDMLPVSIYLKYDIAQTLSSTDRTHIDWSVTLRARSKSLAVDFPNKEDMAETIDTIHQRISLASPMSENFVWAELYLPPAARSPLQNKKLLARSASVLSQVLPQTRDTIVDDTGLRRSESSAMLHPSANISSDTAKDHWIQAQLMKQENAFVTWSDASLFVGTWNVHGSLPTESLSPWIRGCLKINDEDAPKDPDFYIIGLQEMETSTSAYVMQDSTKENAWVDALMSALGDRAPYYYKVAAQQLVTMLIIVLAKRDHLPYISEVEKSYVGVGLMNIMGNKGGETIRFRFHDSYYCFVSSHLAAHTEETDRRNQDFEEISKRLLFRRAPDHHTDYVHFQWNYGGDEGVSYLESRGIVRDWSKWVSIFHADHLVWLGDLNYRINLLESDIKDHLRIQNLEHLLDYDQLTIERKAGRTFSMFEEGAIDFLPTYKYDAGTNEYDTSEKRRAPSWTDRILWKRQQWVSPDQDKHLELLAYKSCDRMMLSDHKPVYALLNTKVRHIDSRLQSKKRQELMDQLKDTHEMMTRGRLHNFVVGFGDVHFMEHKERTTVLENIGQTVAMFRFIPSVDEIGACPPWLKIHPMSGFLGPGEKVMIHFYIHIDQTLSSSFNEGQEVIDNNLILHLEGGQDFFVVIEGNYIPTCFGVPLERLALLSVPIAFAHESRQRTASSSSSSPSASTRTSLSSSATALDPQAPVIRQSTLPKELWSMLNFLWNKNMLEAEPLFVEHGDSTMAQYIRGCLDSGQPFDTSVLLGDDASQKSPPDEMSKESFVGANTMIDVLVAFLDCLPESVIPTSLYSTALECQTPSAFAMLQGAMPNIHLNTLLYLVSFLKDAIRYCPDSYSEQRHEHIGYLFSVLLRPPPGYKERNPAQAKLKRKRFVSFLLQW